MTTTTKLHLTRDRDGNVCLHSETPLQDWHGYWNTRHGETDSLRDAPSILTALLRPFAERTEYNKAKHITLTIQEDEP